MLEMITDEMFWIYVLVNFIALSINSFIVRRYERKRACKILDEEIKRFLRDYIH